MSSESKQNRHTWRRWDGKWIWPGKDVDRGKTFKAVISRSWYILMPVIGIMCSQGSYVRPHLVDAEDTTNRETKVYLEKRDGLALRRSDLDNAVLNVEFEMDTTVVPKIELYEHIVDSLMAIRQTYDVTIPQTEALIDSLEKEHARLKAEAAEALKTLGQREDTRKGLREDVLSTEDQITVLDDSIQVKEARAYRILHPEEFRKKTALFPGEGNYPQRDSLPPKAPN